MEIPYFWVMGKGTDQFDAVLEREPALSEFEIIDELDSRKLYRAEWDTSVDTFIQMLVAHDAILQEASGDAEVWEFQIRFPGSHQLSEFHTACVEKGIDVTVESLYNPIEPMGLETQDLTEGQRSLIEYAYAAGYFEVPRQITLTEMAADLGISDQAVNERLRRGLQTLIGTTLKLETSQES